MTPGLIFPGLELAWTGFDRHASDDRPGRTRPGVKTPPPPTLPFSLPLFPFSFPGPNPSSAAAAAPDLALRLPLPLCTEAFFLLPSVTASSMVSSSGSSHNRGSFLSAGRNVDSSSPIPYRERLLDYTPAVMCKCGAKAARFTSWSDLHPGMRYLKCARARVSNQIGWL